jgi:hypothetical protein
MGCDGRPAPGAAGPPRPATDPQGARRQERRGTGPVMDPARVDPGPDPQLS